MAGEQPLEYDLMRDLVVEMGGRVEWVIVSSSGSSQEAAKGIVSANAGERRSFWLRRGTP